VELVGFAATDPAGEVTLQQEGLAQPPAPVDQHHLPTGAGSRPGAFQSGEFRDAVEERVGLDSHGDREGCISPHDHDEHIMSLCQ
jgi:hypothetical protein